MREKARTEIVSQNVNLDAHELFTQLRLMASLVQVGPSRGFFLSIESIVEKKTTRLWRHWLAESAKRTHSSIANSDRAPEDVLHDTDSLVWVDQNNIAGLKVRVKERSWKRDAPLLLRQDEDQAVSYSLDLEGNLISAVVFLVLL